MTTIVPLGTRGWMPLENRQTMCQLVRYNDSNFIFDCGTGIARFARKEVKELLSPGPLNVIFSHYHLDHIIGLTYLSHLFSPEERQIRLIGPDDKTLDFNVIQASYAITQPPLFGTSIANYKLNIQFVEFGVGEFMIDGVKIQSSKQDHKGGSVAFRLDDEVCYITDAAPTESIAHIADGVKCLIHEAWGLEFGVKGEYHSNIADAFSLARQSKVEHLVPVHFGPDVVESDILSIANANPDLIQLHIPIEGQAIYID